MLKCYFSIHEIHKNSQRLFAMDNYNSKEQSRIIISQAKLYDTTNNQEIGKIIERSTKIMDDDHTTIVEFYLNFYDFGKIVINDIFFIADEQPFHKEFEFETTKFISSNDTFIKENKFLNKNLKIKYTNIYKEFKGIFEINEI